MADPRHEHAGHDLELVARAAAGDLAASEAIAARDLLAGCAACTELAADLRVIAAATRTLPDAASRVARLHAPRDFRLSEADMARLRPGGLAGLGRRLGGLGPAFGPRAQRLGGAFVSLGLVGLLVSAGIPTLFGGSAGGAAMIDAATDVQREGASAPAPIPGTSDDLLAFSTSTDGDRVSATGQALEAAPASPWLTVTAGSIVVVTAGLVLVAIGWRNRRDQFEGT